MTSFEKLAKRIKEELNIEIKPSSLHRTYAGYWQLRAGAWSWVGELATSQDIPCYVGSCETVSNLLRAKKLDCGYINVYEIEINIAFLN